MKHTLIFSGEYHSSQKKTWAIKKLPNFCTITQCGDTDFSCVFHEKHLDKLVDVLKIRKKKQISEETKQRLIKQLEKARLKKIAV